VLLYALCRASARTLAMITNITTSPPHLVQSPCPHHHHYPPPPIWSSPSHNRSSWLFLAVQDFPCYRRRVSRCS